MVSVRSCVDLIGRSRPNRPIKIVPAQVVGPRAEATFEIAVETAGDRGGRGYGDGRRGHVGDRVRRVEGPHRARRCHGELDVVDADVAHVSASVDPRDSYLDCDWLVYFNWFYIVVKLLKLL